MVKTIADEIIESLDDDVFAELDAKMTAGDLKKDLKEIYYQGQDPSFRTGVHLSDIIKAETYKGKPNLCLRKIVLSAFFDPEPVYARHPTIAHFERGADMHRRWQEKFLRAGTIIYVKGVQGLEAVHEVDWHINNRIATEQDWKLLFTPDVIVDMRKGVGIEIVELKGYKQEHYVKLVRNKSYPTTEDAYIQANMYMWLSGIHQAMIIVENKNTQDFQPWRIQFDESVVKPYEDRIALIDELVSHYRDTGQLPKRVCESPDVPMAQQCGGCKVCFMGKAREALRKDKL